MYVKNDVFLPRTHTAHMEKAQEWEAATTFHAQQDIALNHGVCQSVLNQLSYWRPIEYSVIELMHGL